MHDDFIKGKHFKRYYPCLRGIHLSPVNSPHKGQWRGALRFFICAWTNGWANSWDAGDLRRQRAHCDVTVMNLIWLKSYVSEPQQNITQDEQYAQFLGLTICEFQDIQYMKMLSSYSYARINNKPYFPVIMCKNSASLHEIFIVTNSGDNLSWSAVSSHILPIVSVLIIAGFHSTMPRPVFTTGPITPGSTFPSRYQAIRG